MAISKGKGLHKLHASFVDMKEAETVSQPIQIVVSRKLLKA